MPDCCHFDADGFHFSFLFCHFSRHADADAAAVSPYFLCHVIFAALLDVDYATTILLFSCFTFYAAFHFDIATLCRFRYLRRLLLPCRFDIYDAAIISLLCC